jgi:hypothetical protein
VVGEKVREFRDAYSRLGVDLEGFKLPGEQRGKDIMIGWWFQGMHLFGLLVLYPGQPEIQKKIEHPNGISEDLQARKRRGVAKIKAGNVF